VESGKTIIFEALKALLTISITLLASAWFTGSNDIEFKNNSVESYFNVPDAIANKLTIALGENEIKNVSVLNYELFNRTFSDHEKVDIYLSIKDKNPPKLISKKLYPPKRLSAKGITELKTNDPNLIGFNLNMLKTSKNGDHYLINLIFEGEKTPEISISTNNKNLEVVEYKKWKDYTKAGLIVMAGYAIVLSPFALWAYFAEKRSKNRFLQTLCTSWGREVGGLSADQVDYISAVFIEERDRKNEGFIQRIWKRITTTE
jgi:hypothetical protein